MDYFDYLPEDSSNRDVKIAELLEKTQRQEKKRIEAELQRINIQLEQREHLHEELIEDLQFKLDWYIDRLTQSYNRSFGEDEKRQDLKNRIEELYREIRNEHRSRWQDTQRLHKDRRNLIRELNEIEDTVDSIGEGLESLF